MILYLLITFLIIGFLTFIHEFGHFFFAKLFGVPILEFAIGMGPTLFSWKGKTGTKYALRAFPIGGFVSMDGEEGESANPKAYNNLSPWKKIIITAAGPVVNILFAIIMTFALVISMGSENLGTTIVAEFREEAISSSSIEVGDEIIKVGKVKVHIPQQLSYEISNQGYQPVDITVKRNGQTIVLEDVRFDTYESSGITFGNMDFYVYRVANPNVFTFVKEAFFRTFSIFKSTIDSFAGLISGRYGMDAMSGPIGMSGQVGEIVEELEQQGATALYYVQTMINLAVIISMSLGVFNLLPIPALDGGRIVFHLIDGIAGRKVIKKEIEDKINMVAILLLFGLMIVISLKDIINLF